MDHTPSGIPLSLRSICLPCCQRPVAQTCRLKICATVTTYPAQRGEGQGEGCFKMTQADLGQRLQGFPLSPLLLRGERANSRRGRRPRCCGLCSELVSMCLAL